MTIHPDHPFEEPAADRDPVRRLRARLVNPVTVWTAWRGQGDEERRPVGLTVGSTSVVDGAPACVLGALDREADLVEAVTASGRFAVSLLEWPDRHLADSLGGLAPAPGGVFGDGGWQSTDHGPVRAGRSWVGCRLVERRSVGYALLVVGAVEQVVVDPTQTDQEPDQRRPDDGGEPDRDDHLRAALVRLRGRYTTVLRPRG